jgi:hypothetical protein
MALFIADKKYSILGGPGKFDFSYYFDKKIAGEHSNLLRFTVDFGDQKGIRTVEFGEQEDEYYPIGAMVIIVRILVVEFPNKKNSNFIFIVERITDCGITEAQKLLINCSLKGGSSNGTIELYKE